LGTRPNIEQLQIKLESYRLLVEEAKDYAIFFLDLQGNIVTWNMGAERIKQYRPEEIIGKHFSVFYTKEDRVRGRPLRNLRQALANGRFEDEGWRVRKDGSRFWANVVITCLEDQQGEVIGFSKITRDLTERKRSEDRYRLLVEEAKDYAIFFLDLQGNIVTWNMGAERIKQYRPEEIIGKHFSIFYTEEDKKRGRPERNLREALAEGRCEDEGWRLRKDGSRFWASVVITRIEDDQGEIIGFSKITRDLTERKKADDKIRELNEDLERRVRERTAELQAANQALKQRTKEAEEASRLKSQFVSNVSHELRTPINAIIGYTDLLKGEIFGPVNQEQQEALEGIERNAGDLTRLVNDVLDLAKIASGKMSLERSEVDLARLIEEVVAGLRPLAEKKGLSIRCTVERGLPRIESDAGKIKQILVNLLSNAIKFTERGEITVQARRRNDRDGVQVAVQDTGIGIRSEELPKIFDPFHQVNGASTREHGGVGLGLAIVRELLQILDGDIYVESEYGRGSTFAFFLPYRTSAAASS